MASLNECSLLVISRGDIPWGWVPHGRHIQVRNVSAVLFVVGHEYFNFKFTVKASKSMFFKIFPRYVHLGIWDELEAQDQQGS
jgi:hypothetical protein